jgi:hypothetical protein
MNPRRAFFGLVLLAILVACGGAVYWFLRPPAYTSPQEYEKMINAGLPAGTPKTEVKAWLTAHHISSEETADEKDRKILRGTVDLTKRWLSYPSGYIWLDFYFDDHEMLASHHVHSWLYTW